VAPPSRGAHDGTWTWIGRSVDTPVKPIPAWLLDLFHSNRAKGEPTENSHRTSSRNGQRALEVQVGRLLLTPEGGRNDALNRAAFALGRFVGAGDLPAETVAGALGDVAVRVGLTEAEAIATIRSGLASGVGSRRKIRA
jgi:hypothetical protein